MHTISHNEIITLFGTLKGYGNHTEKIFTTKTTEIIQDNHTEIFSFFVQGYCNLTEKF